MVISDVPDSATTLSITTFSITTLDIKGLFVTLIVTTLCHYAGCAVSFIVMLNVLMQSVVILNEAVPSVIMLSVVSPSCIANLCPEIAQVNCPKRKYNTQHD
jgi:hypothetical protein